LARRRDSPGVGKTVIRWIYTATAVIGGSEPVPQCHQRSLARFPRRAAGKGKKEDTA